MDGGDRDSILLHGYSFSQSDSIARSDPYDIDSPAEMYYEITGGGKDARTVNVSRSHDQGPKQDHMLEASMSMANVLTGISNTIANAATKPGAILRAPKDAVDNSVRRQAFL